MSAKSRWRGREQETSDAVRGARTKPHQQQPHPPRSLSVYCCDEYLPWSWRTRKSRHKEPPQFPHCRECAAPPHQHIGERRNPPRKPARKRVRNVRSACRKRDQRYGTAAARAKINPGSPAGERNKNTGTRRPCAGAARLAGHVLFGTTCFFRNTWALPICFICTTPYCACFKATMHRLFCFRRTYSTHIEGSCRTAMDDQASEQSDK